MTDNVRPAVAVSQAPRHLRKRAFRGEIPVSRLGGYSSPGKPQKPPVQPSAEALVRSSAEAPDWFPLDDDADRRRKRQIALVIVILVAITVPVLALLLIFGQ